MKLLKSLSSITGLRTLAIVVCVLTNAYFVTAFFYAPASDPSGNNMLAVIATLTGSLMVLGFFTLRFAMRGLSSARREQLDELQLQMRDDSYRLAYLVVRRVGLGVLLALSLSFETLNHAIENQGASNVIVPVTGWQVAGFPALGQYLHGLLGAANVMSLVFKLVFVLAFTAYCFPLVVLAWRNAKYKASLSPVDREAFENAGGQ